MRVLFLTQYFPPETGAVQNRLSDLADRLALLGHKVTVLTALPNYPGGEIFPGYRRRFVVSESRGQIRVIRTWLFATKSKEFLPKLLNYFSFTILSFFVGLLKLSRMDVCFVESPPLFLGITGYLLSRLKKAKFVLNISDLWPESAIALGVLRNPRIIRWSIALERGLYRRAQLVTGQTEGIVDAIGKRYSLTPRALLTNGVAPEFLLKIESTRALRNEIRNTLGFAQKFIVAYTGVHGFSQGLETVLQAAEILTSYQDILFAFYGDGPQKPRLQELAAEKRLPNVRFLPSQPAEYIPQILVAIDASIVPLRRTDLFKGALPSKLFEALGASVPVIAAVEGEAERLVNRSGGGIVVEPENPAALAAAIVQLYLDPDLRRTLGANGRVYVAAHYNRNVIADKLDSLLRAVQSSTLVTSEDGFAGELPPPATLDLLNEGLSTQK
jgi:glycosyltransferase involved in cell wall biosynthesis